MEAALRYPLFVLSFAGLVFLAMLFKIVPDVLGHLRPLPGAAAAAHADPALDQPGGAFTVRRFPLAWRSWLWVAALANWSRTEGGRFAIDRVKLNFPLFGPLIRMYAITKFARTLGILTASGTQILGALKVMRPVPGNKVLERGIDDVRAQVEEGISLSRAMSDAGVFPEMLVQMTATGEETGKLDQMLIAHCGLLRAARHGEGRGAVLADRAHRHRGARCGHRSDAGGAVPADLQPRPGDALRTVGSLSQDLSRSNPGRSDGAPVNGVSHPTQPRRRIHPMKRFSNAQGGFTLMELMVVIVIVAILAAVAVPLYINYVNDARDTEAKGAIGAIITAEQTYRQAEPDERVPERDQDAAQRATSATSRRANWDFTVTRRRNDRDSRCTATGKVRRTREHGRLHVPARPAWIPGRSL